MGFWGAGVRIHRARADTILKENLVGANFEVVNCLVPTLLRLWNLQVGMKLKASPKLTCSPILAAVRRTVVLMVPLPKAFSGCSIRLEERRAPNSEP